MFLGDVCHTNIVFRSYGASIFSWHYSVYNIGSLRDWEERTPCNLLERTGVFDSVSRNLLLDLMTAASLS